MGSGGGEDGRCQAIGVQMMSLGEEAAGSQLVEMALHQGTIALLHGLVRDGTAGAGDHSQGAQLLRGPNLISLTGTFYK